MKFKNEDYQSAKLILENYRFLKMNLAESELVDKPSEEKRLRKCERAVEALAREEKNGKEYYEIITRFYTKGNEREEAISRDLNIGQTKFYLLKREAINLVGIYMRDASD